METPLTRAAAVELLRGLIAIPSTSHNESEAAHWLAAQMAAFGYPRAYVDDAGNAVGELGAPDAPVTLVLLGHIDTVPGVIPVRIEGPLLYGRGSVDAKGPLVTFVAAGALAGETWARAAGVRLVVVGAVEEEAATSKGARFIRDRFDGLREPAPTACLIGEPSGAGRITLGYKGRLLIEMQAAQPMAHTAGPDAGVAVTAVAFWNRIAALAAAFNQGREKVFDQLQPSLRRLHTWSDETLNECVEASVGLRLPLDADAAALRDALGVWAAAETGADEGPDGTWVGERKQVSLRFHAHEPAWRADRSGSIVRALLNAIRAEQPDVRPGFVLKTGTSDMNVVAPAWGCPIAAYGPGDSALDHTPNEHIDLDEYWLACRTLARALRDFTSFL